MPYVYAMTILTKFKVDRLFVTLLFLICSPPKTSLVPTLIKKFGRQLLCSVSLSICKFLIKIWSFYWMDVYNRSSDVWEIHYFCYHEKLQS